MRVTWHPLPHAKPRGTPNGAATPRRPASLAHPVDPAHRLRSPAGRAVSSRALRDPKMQRAQDPAGQLRGVLARVLRGPGRRRGTGARGPDVPGLPARGSACPPAMAVTGGVLLQLSQPPAAAPGTVPRRRRTPARQVSSDPASEPSARARSAPRLSSVSGLELFTELRWASQTLGGVWGAPPGCSRRSGARGGGARACWGCSVGDSEGRDGRLPPVRVRSPSPVIHQPHLFSQPPFP